MTITKTYDPADPRERQAWKVVIIKEKKPQSIRPGKISLDTFEWKKARVKMKDKGGRYREGFHVFVNKENAERTKTLLDELDFGWEFAVISVMVRGVFVEGELGLRSAPSLSISPENYAECLVAEEIRVCKGEHTNS